jgi:hypothetical protein
VAGKNPLFGKPDTQKARIPLVCDYFIRGPLPLTTDIKKGPGLENCQIFAYKNNEGKDVLYAEPGYITGSFANLGAQYRCATSWMGAVTYKDRAIIGGTNTIKIYNLGTLATTVDIPTVGAGTIEYIKESKNGTTPIAIVGYTTLTNNITTWEYVNDAGVASNAITISATTVGQMVELDGYHFIAESAGTIRNSALNDITTWPATGLLPTNFSPDPAVGLAKYKNTIVSFGTQALEFYENVGNPVGSPLQRIPQYASNIGCSPSTNYIGTGNNRTYIEAFDSVYWVGYNVNNRAPGIYTLEDYKPKKISNDSIDRILTQAPCYCVISGAFTIQGKNYLLFRFTGTLSADTVYFLYDIKYNIWQKWRPAADEANIQIGNLFVDNTIYFAFSTISGSNFLKSVSGDSIGVSIELRTDLWDGNTHNLKRIHDVRLIGSQTTTAAQTASLSWTDNDYESYSTARTFDLTKKNPRLTGCGTTYKRAFRIITATNHNQKYEALELTYSEMDH